MPFNGSGTFVRLYNWTNDANNNIPISANRFDGEDNDFASGLSLCLTRDGQGAPSTPLTWSQPLTINVGTDETVYAAGRTGGVNNPQLQLKVADSFGASINLSTAQSLALQLSGSNVIVMGQSTTTLGVLGGAADITINQSATGGLTMGTSGQWTFAAPSGNNPTITINGNASQVNGALFILGGQNQWSEVIHGNSTSGQSYGLLIQAGTTSADYAFRLQSQGGANDLLVVKGDGDGYIATASAGQSLVWNAAGAFTLNAPQSGIGFTINAVSGQFALKAIGNATSGGSYGLEVAAGTLSSDICAVFNNQANSTTFFEIYGDGEVVVNQPSAATQQSSPFWQVGYLDTPLNAQTGASYQFVLTDRGKFIRAGAGFTYTIPANSSVAFPVGTTIVLMNAGGTSCSIAITTDTLTWLPSGGAGTRTLAPNSVATLYKFGSTSWYVWGFGLT